MKINWQFWKKEESQLYPQEWGVITYNDNALKNGIEDISNKLIIRYKWDYRTERFKIYKVYGYSDSLIYTLKKKLKIPIYDMTQKEIKFPIYSEILLDEVEYGKG